MKSSRSQNVHKARSTANDTANNNNNSNNNNSNNNNALLLRNTSSIHSIDTNEQSLLSCKPHAFSGAVLNPKQARELTPKIVLGITITLGNYALESKFHGGAGGDGSNGETNMTNNTHSKSNSKSNTNRNTKSNTNSYSNHKYDNSNEAKVQYTVWITEAWKCLGWAEPSAALFWEMATMYHTLHVAARSIEVEEKETIVTATANNTTTGSNNTHHDYENNHGDVMGIQRTLSQSIPPILSCGSSASMESIEKKGGGGGGTKLSNSTATSSTSNNIHNNNSNSNLVEDRQLSPRPDSTTATATTKKNSSSQHNHHHTKASAASAKELPVWLIGMYLLLHCEEGVFRRNVSGEDAQRFDALMAKGNTSSTTSSNSNGNNGSDGGGTLSGGISTGNSGHNANSGIGDLWKIGKGVDFGTLLMQPNLSLRAHLHGSWVDYTNFTIYILRHLRKFILLSAVPHNPDAQLALESLMENESKYDKEYTDRQHTPSSSYSNNNHRSSSLTSTSAFVSSLIIDPYGNLDADEMLRRHDEEHGTIGLSINLTYEDIERLNFILQSPSGGLIDDPPLYISELLPAEEFAMYGGIPLEEVEREVRQQLELDLLNGGNREDKSLDEKNDVDSATNDMGKLDLNEGNGSSSSGGGDHQDGNVVNGKGRAEVSSKAFHKELKYSKVRGKTVLLKPNAESRIQPQQQQLHQQQPSNEEKNGDDDNNKPPTSPSLCTNGRLHDVIVAECSDAHMYLLQPFEHATISACSNCTIVVGAVAGLLHVVDCEKMTITSAARRILVSNCNDISQYIFTPSPPLLVGNNRNCQFAPYNTYYDGLREDLLATGLAGAVVSADNVIISDSVHGPALQCASNKWKQPVELNKICDVLATRNADDKALGSNEDTMQTPTLVPASEFQVLFVPVESLSIKQRRSQQEANIDEKSDDSADGPKIGSLYCNCLADVLQLSPFRLPTEYERRVLVKADRIRSLQQLIQSDLTPEQQLRLEEELNRGFRDWMVTSGHLRQVLDLVHLENKV